MKSQSPVIIVKDVQTRFGTAYVHQCVSFSIGPGTIVALIGESGSGKSVLLKEMIGLLRPTAGNIYLFGKNVWQCHEDTLKKLRSRIGVLFQNGALFSALSVEENVAVPLREQTDLSDSLVRAIVHLCLAFTGLPPETCLKMPSELSGGMRKRVALARALALEPEVLFLDEPTSGLDPINARAFDRLVRTLCDSLDLTIFLATHDLDTIAGIADRIIVLSRGTIIADGALEDIARVDDPWLQAYFSSRVT